MSRPEAAEFFGRRVAWYDDGYDRVDSDGHAVRARMAAALQLIGPGPGTVLDAGMGPGRLCTELARRNWTVSGVDAAEEMVAVARRRLGEGADRLLVGEIEALPFPDGSFDVVAATGVLEYADVPRALAELARVLVPGGRAVVSYPNPHALPALWRSFVWYTAVRAVKRLLRMPHPSIPRGASAIPAPRFERLLAAAGLEPVARVVSSFLVLPSPVDIALPRLAARLGEAVESRGPTWLGTQVLYEARKPVAQGS